MKVLSILNVALFFAVLFAGSAVVMAEASIAPDQLKLGKQELTLQGSGMRSRMFIDLYVGSLYLSEATNSAENIISENIPMAIGLLVESSLITSEKLQEATKDGFQKSVGDTSTLDERIEKLLTAFDGSIGVGDSFYLSWNPELMSVEVFRDGELIERVAGLDFKQALFGIWLGEDPVQDSLKEEMLGAL